MITFEINKWVLVAIICGIMLLGALVELLIACIYSNRDNAKKAISCDKADMIAQLANEIKLQNVDMDLMQQNIGYLMDECNRLSEQKDTTGISAKSDAIKWLRFTELHNGLKKRVETVEKDFHDLEEHVHNWLNSKPVLKVEDKDMEVESYIRDYYVPTRTEAVLKAKDKDTEARSYSRDCYVPTGKEAMRIIRNLYDKFNDQGYVTVSEYLAEFGKPHTRLQEHYGWNEFDFSEVFAQYVNGAYKVHMPEPILLFDD